MKNKGDYFKIEFSHLPNRKINSKSKNQKTCFNRQKKSSNKKNTSKNTSDNQEKTQKIQLYEQKLSRNDKDKISNHLNVNNFKKFNIFHINSHYLPNGTKKSKPNTQKKKHQNILKKRTKRKNVSNNTHIGKESLKLQPESLINFNLYENENSHKNIIKSIPKQKLQSFFKMISQKKKQIPYSIGKSQPQTFHIKYKKSPSNILKKKKTISNFIKNKTSHKKKQEIKSHIVSRRQSVNPKVVRKHRRIISENGNLFNNLQIPKQNSKKNFDIENPTKNQQKKQVRKHKRNLSENIQLSKNIYQLNQESQYIQNSDQNKFNFQIIEPKFEDPSFDEEILDNSQTIKLITPMSIRSTPPEELINLSQNCLKTTVQNYKTKIQQILESKKIILLQKLKQNEFSQTTLDFYYITKILGEGSYAKVYQAYSILSQKPVAIKCFEKFKLKQDKNQDRLQQEINLLNKIDNKFIISVLEVFQNDKFVFVVLEYVNDYDLLMRLKNSGKFKESKFKNIFIQICQGLNYLHQNNILHRDIKLDNILIDKNDQIKICDFGISKLITPNELNFEHIGTPAYLAPEVIKENGYLNFASDIWSLGILTFIALTGMVPFKGNSIEELNENIINHEIDFSNPKINISTQMKMILKNMLNKNPLKRITLKQISQVMNFPLEQKMIKTILKHDTIRQIETFGFNKQFVLDSIHQKKLNHSNTLYFLLNNDQH